MKRVRTFGTGRHKRQADITLLFQYTIYKSGILLECMSIYLQEKELVYTPCSSKEEMDKFKS